MATLPAPSAIDDVGNAKPAVETEAASGQPRGLSLSETINVIDTQLATAMAQHDIAASNLTRLMEATKLLSDYFKHLATLSTGSILIILTLHEKLFATGAPKWVLVVAICPFLVSISLALFAQQFMPSIWTRSEHPAFQRRFASYSATRCLIAFVLGLIVMVCVVAVGG